MVPCRAGRAEKGAGVWAVAAVGWGWSWVAGPALCSPVEGASAAARGRRGRWRAAVRARSNRAARALDTTRRYAEGVVRATHAAWASLVVGACEGRGLSVACGEAAAVAAQQALAEAPSHGPGKGGRGRMPVQATLQVTAGGHVGLHLS